MIVESINIHEMYGERLKSIIDRFGAVDSLGDEIDQRQAARFIAEISRQLSQYHIATTTDYRTVEQLTDLVSWYESLLGVSPAALFKYVTEAKIKET